MQRCDLAEALRVQPALRKIVDHPRKRLLPSASSSHLFGHDQEAPLAPFQRERGQETMAKKVIRNRTSAVLRLHCSTVLVPQPRSVDAYVNKVL